jgi:hypothetical protein
MAHVPASAHAPCVGPDVPADREPLSRLLTAGPPEMVTTSVSSRKRHGYWPCLRAPHCPPR